MSNLSIKVISGPTVSIEYAGLHFLTDPTFDPETTYDLGGGASLRKTKGSPVEAQSLLPVDAVLLSHDHHPDNLDNAGREFLAEVPLTLTTQDGAARLGGEARGLAPWETFEIQHVTVTALPALHGPDGDDTEDIIGQVIGFLLAAEGESTVYISGDNASLKVVEQIAERVSNIDTAVIFAGAARSPFFDGAPLTLDGQGAVEATKILKPAHVVIAHADSWEHFSDTMENAHQAFENAGMGDLLRPAGGVF